jgi:hypothetical protein
MGASHEVGHDEEEGKFSVAVEGLESHLAYEKRDDGTLVLYHTFVPKALRNRGIAASLVKAALAHAEEHGFRVLPTCSYVVSYMDRHEEYAHLRRSDGSDSDIM